MQQKFYKYILNTYLHKFVSSICIPLVHILGQYPLWRNAFPISLRVEYYKGKFFFIKPIDLVLEVCPNRAQCAWYHYHIMGTMTNFRVIYIELSYFCFLFLKLLICVTIIVIFNYNFVLIGLSCTLCPS